MNEKKIKKFVEHFPLTEIGKSLAELTSIKIGGPAELYLELELEKELKNVIKFCLKNEIKFFILGWGKNVVFDDKGYDGLVIRLAMTSIKMKGKTKIEAQAGSYLSDIIKFGHENGLVGMEDLAGIPSTLGGAIFGNAGAFKRSITDFVKEIRVFEINFRKKKIVEKKLKIQELDPSYRDSMAKVRRNIIILEAGLVLMEGDVLKAKERVKEVLEHRNKSHPLEYPNAGCVFKNPDGGYAGKLIEVAGLKGLKVGGLRISVKHANFIVNIDDGTFEDYKELTSIIKEKVKEKSGIDLEVENIVIRREED